MKKAFLICIAALATGADALAQNEVDALRYSQLSLTGGSARFMGMAGAFGALGGDISSLSYNPAGVAVYRKNEFSFTPAFYSQSTSSLYNGTGSSELKQNFNFSHFGLVGAFVNKENDANNSGWVSANIGLGYNRMNNFHGRLSIGGTTYGKTLLDVMASGSNGYTFDNLDQFGAGLFFQAALIDTLNSDGTSYYSIFPDSAKVGQFKFSETSGAMSETTLSFGGNYGNRIYVGATVGLPRLRYVEESDYSEIDDQDTVAPFKDYTYSTNLTTRGTGINFKFGLIYRITDWIRIGGALHSPSFFRMNDNYSNSVTVRYDAYYAPYTAASPEGVYDYRLNTPMRAIGSLGFVIRKKAMLDADYEFVDYSTARLRSNPMVFNEVNSDIRNKYTQASNIRVGGEYRADPLSLRAGFAFYGSPYKPGVNLDEADRVSFSGGIGFRENNYFIDFAYVHTQYSENYYLYDPAVSSPVKNDFSNNNFLLTIGWKY